MFKIKTLLVVSMFAMNCMVAMDDTVEEVIVEQGIRITYEHPEIQQFHNLIENLSKTTKSSDRLALLKEIASEKVHKCAKNGKHLIPDFYINNQNIEAYSIKFDSEVELLKYELSLAIFFDNDGGGYVPIVMIKRINPLNGEVTIASLPWEEFKKQLCDYTALKYRKSISGSSSGNCTIS